MEQRTKNIKRRMRYAGTTLCFRGQTGPSGRKSENSDRARSVRICEPRLRDPPGAACVADGLFDAPVHAGNPEFIWPVPGDFMGVISYFSTPDCAVGMTGRIRVDHLDWPAVFDPLQLLTVNLQMDPLDWNTIRHDSTLLIEVPAMFWQDGDQPIPVLVRRKSGLAMPSEADPQKVSLKIDINDLVSGQKWHELTKLSLENGDDEGLVREG